MELVDANTKNYVFLTLSQFNEKQRLVRTRVSMRRDQPFWDGGNSYICCESFRVTASPSQGGLYYKIFPASWYMGCSLLREATHAPLANTYELVQQAGTASTGIGMGRAINAGNVSFDPAAEAANAELYIQAVKLDNTREDINTPDPTTIQGLLNKWVNHYYLTKGAWIRLQIPAGADQTNPGYYGGPLTESPSNFLNGNGFGPDRLYYPELKSTQYDTPSFRGYLQAIGHLQAPPTLPGVARFALFPQPNAPAGTKIDASEKELFEQNLGSAMVLQQRTTDAAPHLFDPRLKGAAMTVYGLLGMEYLLEKRIFDGQAADDKTVAKMSGKPRYAIKYSEFKVGAVCWVDIPLGGGPQTERVYGTISAFPNDYAPIIEDHYCYSMYMMASVDLYNLLHSGWASNDPNQALFAASCFAGCYDDTPICRAISYNVSFPIKSSNNLGIAGANDSHWDFNTAKVLLSNRHRNGDEKLCVRRPGQQAPRYMFTPNEMFYAFNKKEQGVDLPYKLQTDENGGFVIRWHDDHLNPGTNFVISVELSQELGLNEYFEYEREVFLGEQSVDKFYVQQDTRYPWMQDSQVTMWINRSDLSTTDPVGGDDPKWTPAPAQPAVNPDFGNAPDLWDIGGTKYQFITSHQNTWDSYESQTARVYPLVETDSDGVKFLNYRDLPVDGRIGNTQQVSVESFSTYSEITIVIPNLPFQSMLGTNSDERILASLRLPFGNGTANDVNGEVTNTTFSYYGDLIFNTLASRSYLKVTTDQQLYDCDVEVRLIRRDGEMDVMQLPYKGEFQVKLRLLQTQ